MNLQAHAERWIDREERYLKASTAQVYRRAVRRIVAHFGGCDLEDLQWPPVRDWLRSLDLSERSAANLLSVFRVVIDGAIDDGLLEDNCLAGRRPRMKGRAPPRQTVEPFDAKERAALLGGCDGLGERNMLQFMWWTGLRISEMIALDWADVGEASVSVSKAMTQAAREPERTKTRCSTRDVHLLRPARAALDSQRALTRLAGGAVFVNPSTGCRWSGDASIRKMFARVCRRAGVRYRHPYTLRHTYASMMLTAGEDLGWIAAQMGHSNPTITGRVYAKFIAQDGASCGGKKAEYIFS